MKAKESTAGTRFMKDARALALDWDTVDFLITHNLLLHKFIIASEFPRNHHGTQGNRVHSA